MTAQTANKATVPVGSDGWNPTAHIKQAIETARTIIPVADVTERNGLAALFPGGTLPVPSFVWRADLGIMETWTGTVWLSRPHVEFTYNTAVGAIPDATGWGPGVLTLDTSAVSTDTALATSPSADKLTIAKVGEYAVWFGGAFGSGLNGTSWFQIKNGTDTEVYASGPANDFWGHASIPNFRVTADNTTLWFRLKQTSGVANNSAGRIRITRIG